MKTAQLNRAISSFLRGLPYESAFTASAAVITQEAVFVRAFGVVHTQNNIVSCQLRGRDTGGPNNWTQTSFGIGAKYFKFHDFLYMPNGVAISTSGSAGTAGRFGGQILFIRLANVPWLRGLDQPDISEIYARAATISGLIHEQNAA